MINEANAFAFEVNHGLRWTKSRSRITTGSTTWILKLVRLKPRRGRRTPFRNGAPQKTLQIAIRLPEGSEPTVGQMLTIITNGTALTAPENRHQWRIYRFFTGEERHELIELAK